MLASVLRLPKVLNESSPHPAKGCTRTSHFTSEEMDAERQRIFPQVSGFSVAEPGPLTPVGSYLPRVLLENSGEGCRLLNTFCGLMLGWAADICDLILFSQIYRWVVLSALYKGGHAPSDVAVLASDIPTPDIPGTLVLPWPTGQRACHTMGPFLNLFLGLARTHRKCLCTCFFYSDLTLATEPLQKPPPTLNTLFCIILHAFEMGF